MNVRRRRIKERVEREKRRKDNINRSNEWFARVFLAIDLAKKRGDKHVGPRFLKEAFGTQPLLRVVNQAEGSRES